MTTRERPILFGGEMVKAILEGHKTQTRRIVRFHKDPYIPHHEWVMSVHQDGGGNWIAWSSNEPDLAEFTKRAYPDGSGFHCPYGKVGDLLWVRETFVIESNFNIDNERAYPPPFSDGRPIRWEEDQEYGRWWRQCHYRATDPDPELYEEDCDSDHEGPCTHWRPSIHMPRWASRIALGINLVRVERLQAIRWDGIYAEGVRSDPPKHWYSFDNSREKFIGLWDTVNAKRGFSWVSNPWVWVIEFHKVQVDWIPT